MAANLLANAQVLDKSGNKVNPMDSDKVLLYFTASWCPPCRAFTPKLNDAYKAWKGEGKSVSVVFVSSDQDEESHNNYYGHMDFFQIKFGDAAIQALAQEFKVSGIPFLVVLNNKGEVLSTNARNDVAQKGKDALDGW